MDNIDFFINYIDIATLCTKNGAMSQGHGAKQIPTILIKMNLVTLIFYQQRGDLEDQGLRSDYFYFLKTFFELPSV